MSLAPAELESGHALHELLSLHLADEATGEVRQIATVGVKDLGAETTQVLGRKLSEWSTDQLKEQLRDAFDADPFSLMLQAWSQVRKVHRAAKESLGPPPTARSVALLQHEIDLKVEPRLVLNVSGIDWCTVQLALTLKFSFESVVLDLMGGQLTGLKLGNPTGALSFACEGHDVAQFKRDIKLRAAYAFNPPLAWPVTALSLSGAGAVAAAH